MSTKLMNFTAFNWLIGVLICLVLEGTYFGTSQTSVINELGVIQAIKSGGIFAVGSATVNFFHGLMRILLWDYSFYTGVYGIFRVLWIIVLDCGVVWGVIQGLSAVFSNFIPRL